MSLQIERIDDIIIPFLRRWGVPALRISLATVFPYSPLQPPKPHSGVLDLSAGDSLNSHRVNYGMHRE